MFTETTETTPVIDGILSIEATNKSIAIRLCDVGSIETEDGNRIIIYLRGSERFRILAFTHGDSRDSAYATAVAAWKASANL